MMYKKAQKIYKVATENQAPDLSTMEISVQCQ